MYAGFIISLGDWNKYSKNKRKPFIKQSSLLFIFFDQADGSKQTRPLIELKFYPAEMRRIRVEVGTDWKLHYIFVWSAKSIILFLCELRGKEQLRNTHMFISVYTCSITTKGKRKHPDAWRWNERKNRQ